MKSQRKNKSTYLVYDEVTKLIDVIPAPKCKFQLWLERNKIYFETIMMVFLSVAGIIVSAAGIIVANVANDISLEESRIEDLEKQPAFVYYSETAEDKTSHIIQNVGGDIKYGNVFMDKALVVSIYNKNYDYLGKGYILLGGYYEKDYSNYDFETKRFELHSSLESKSVLEWIERIEGLILQEGFFCGIECTDYFDFMYKDYKLEMIQKSALLQAGVICDIERSGDYEFKIRINLNDTDAELSKELKDELALLVKYAGI